MLLQHQYSKKDLNYELVKKYNFTEIAGPTLKELDNIKKLESMQKDWKKKENTNQKEKSVLLEHIQIKAQRNEEKDQVSHLMNPKNKLNSFIKDEEVEKSYEKVNLLAKRLKNIELHNCQSEDKLQNKTTFNMKYVGKYVLSTLSESNSKTGLNSIKLSKCKKR